ncbi:MAG: hypothetical protein ACOCQR_02870 [bacterium]
MCNVLKYKNKILIFTLIIIFLFINVDSLYAQSQNTENKILEFGRNIYQMNQNIELFGEIAKMPAYLFNNTKQTIEGLEVTADSTLYSLGIKDADDVISKATEKTPEHLDLAMQTVKGIPACNDQSDDYDPERQDWCNNMIAENILSHASMQNGFSGLRNNALEKVFADQFAQALGEDGEKAQLFMETYQEFAEIDDAEKWVEQTTEQIFSREGGDLPFVPGQKMTDDVLQNIEDMEVEGLIDFNVRDMDFVEKYAPKLLPPDVMKALNFVNGLICEHGEKLDTAPFFRPQKPDVTISVTPKVTNPTPGQTVSYDMNFTTNAYKFDEVTVAGGIIGSFGNPFYGNKNPIKEAGFREIVVNVDAPDSRYSTPQQDLSTAIYSASSPNNITGVSFTAKPYKVAGKYYVNIAAIDSCGQPKTTTFQHVVFSEGMTLEDIGLDRNTAPFQKVTGYGEDGPRDNDGDHWLTRTEEDQENQENTNYYDHEYEDASYDVDPSLSPTDALYEDSNNEVRADTGNDLFNNILGNVFNRNNNNNTGSDQNIDIMDDPNYQEIFTELSANEQLEVEEILNNPYFKNASPTERKAMIENYMSGRQSSKDNIASVMHRGPQETSAYDKLNRKVKQTKEKQKQQKHEIKENIKDVEEVAAEKNINIDEILYERILGKAKDANDDFIEFTGKDAAKTFNRMVEATTDHNGETEVNNETLKNIAGAIRGAFLTEGSVNTDEEGTVMAAEYSQRAITPSLVEDTVRVNLKKVQGFYVMAESNAENAGFHNFYIPEDQSSNQPPHIMGQFEMVIPEDIRKLHGLRDKRGLYIARIDFDGKGRPYYSKFSEGHIFLTQTELELAGIKYAEGRGFDHDIETAADLIVKDTKTLEGTLSLSEREAVIQEGRTLPTKIDLPWIAADFFVSIAMKAGGEDLVRHLIEQNNKNVDVKTDESLREAIHQIRKLTPEIRNRCGKKNQTIMFHNMLKIIEHEDVDPTKVRCL